MNQNKKAPTRRNDWGIILVLVLLIIGMFFTFRNLSGIRQDELQVQEFTTIVNEKRLKSMNISPVGGVSSNDGLYVVEGSYIFNVDNNEIRQYKVIIDEKTLDSIKISVIENQPNVNILYNPVSSNLFLEILVSLLPFVIIAVGFYFMFRANLGGNNKTFEFTKSRAQLSRDKTVTFKDVAGCDEEKQELEEIIDFLKNPVKYVEIGARIPKGILLAGPPGTGKTLIARAVAGEASVPFYSISGSDFVEMFVGLGASRVRDLFKTAKENSPCIIFIDEIDAVGRQRGAGMGGGHDEREQTLNQLLVEMDGFKPNSGIIIMAATNRPDVLDPALLRPGRFDRQITIANPDVKGREAILRVHARNKKFDSSVKFDEVAHRTPGFSGAEIENLLNEAALLAARDNRKVINIHDIDEATDRVMMGPAKKSRKMTDKERNTIAHHEAGHAVIGLKLENSNIVQKVTIVPRGQAGGYALMLPEEETYLETKQSLLDRITGYLGGRASEELNFNEVSTGAHNDFQQATRIARAMVTEYGMSSLGPVQYEQNSGSVFLGRDYLKDKNFSDALAHDIDKEVRSIIEDCYDRAKRVLTENMDLLKVIAHYLLEIETLTKSDIDEIEKTGKLSWYEEEKAKKAQNLSDNNIEENQDVNQE